MGQFIEQGALLLFVAAIVAMVARRFRFPYAVGLVLTGLALRWLPGAPVLALTRDLLFTLLLPPLIFEGAMFLCWRTLRSQLPVVVTLASLGVLLSAGVTGLAMHGLAGWPMNAALAFGALISATDPVAVLATFRELGLRGRLRLLVEAESLFNDGTAAVLFATVVAIGVGQPLGPADVALGLLLAIGGGMLSGTAVALAARFLAGRTTDPLVEITFTVVAAYGSFLLAEHVGGSGVVATLAAGLVFGERRTRAPLSPRERGAVEAFWEFVAFAANSLVFLLIGLEEGRTDFAGVLGTALLAVLVATASRAAAVYPIAALFRGSALRVSAAHQHVLVWGGLRGALALALALGLPEGFALRAQIVSATFAVVAFSIVVQGVSLPALLRRLGMRVRPARPKPVADLAKETGT
jgi:CPA1 family monovalent cation:H+ antiporter